MIVDGSLLVERVSPSLPADWALLQDDARQEGLGIVDRLAEEWATGANRFSRAGEMLLAARFQGHLVGIGGMTQEAARPGALRMRRFYVRPPWRRLGVGRRIATALLAASPGRVVTVNAGTVVAPAFWEALGFVPASRDGYTHVLDRYAGSTGEGGTPPASIASPAARHRSSR